nr:MAG TPA_asm: hypothetical protein [Caudoviricetes sp.]
MPEIGCLLNSFVRCLVKMNGKRAAKTSLRRTKILSLERKFRQASDDARRLLVRTIIRPKQKRKSVRTHLANGVNTPIRKDSD